MSIINTQLFVDIHSQSISCYVEFFELEMLFEHHESFHFLQFFPMSSTLLNSSLSIFHYSQKSVRRHN